MQLVPDVHAFLGHIACDSASESELVLPMTDATGRFVGVLDLDSTVPAHFTTQDVEALTILVDLLGCGCNWSKL